MIDKKHLIQDILLGYRNKFENNNFIIIDNFLEDIFFKQVTEEIKHGKIKIFQTHISDTKQVHDIYIEGSELQKLNNFIESPIFLKFISLIYGYEITRERFKDTEKNKDKLNLKTDLGFIGAQMYDNGCFFDWHIDGVNSISQTSSGAAIFYIHKSDPKWKDSFGGVLELQIKNNKGESIEKNISPLENRLVILKNTNDSWHRVTKVQGKYYRISLQTTLLKT